MAEWPAWRWLMYWIKYSASTHFGFNRQFIVNDSFVRGTIKHTTGHACRFSCLTVYDFSTEAPPTLCFTVLLRQTHWYVRNRNDMNNWMTGDGESQNIWIKLAVWIHQDFSHCQIVTINSNFLVQCYANIKYKKKN